MTRWRLFLAAAGILGTGVAAEHYAQLHDLYFIEGWLDIPMHFLCGIGAGFLTLWVMAVLGVLPVQGVTQPLWDQSFGRQAPWWRTFIAVLAGAAFIGIVWELYEVFLLNLSGKPFPVGYIFDTLKDVMNDLLGAGIAWVAFRKVQWNIWRAEA